MPKYLYECDCGFQSEENHGMKSEPKMLCPDCGDKMYRVVSGGTGFIFKEGNGAISNKPDSYWTNAEQNRIKDMKKRAEQQKEKIKYKDPKMINQMVAHAENLKSTGRVGESDQLNKIIDAQ